MADLLVISDQASKSIREDLYPTLQENHWRTSGHPVLMMLGFEDKATDQTTGPVNRPRIKPVEHVSAGRQIEVVHEHSLFGGGYAVAEDTALSYGKRAEDRSLATIRFYEGAFKVSRQDIAATRNNDLALVEVISRHASNALRQAQKDLGRMTTYKKEGVLAIVDGAVTASTIVAVDNGGTTEGVPTRFLRPTLKVWIGTKNQIEAGTADEAEINVIRSRTGFSVVGAGTFADDDRVVPKGVYSGGSYREFACLDELVAATGTVQGVNKATNYWFASDVTGSVGTLAISDIDTTVVSIRNYSADPSQIFAMAGPTVWRRYSDLLTANKRLTTNKKDYSGMVVGGASQLSYYAPDGDYPVFLCTDVADQEMYFLDANGYFWAEMLPIQFEDTGSGMNGIPGQRITGSTNYEFPFLHYGQFVQTNARSSGRLTGITA